MMAVLVVVVMSGYGLRELARFVCVCVRVGVCAYEPRPFK